MSYKITISKASQETQEKDGEFLVIDKRPWTEKELSEGSGFYRSQDSDFLKNNPLKEIRGYAPRREVIATVDVKVLEQTVENLDISAVIKAINGL